MADFDVRSFWERYVKKIGRAFQARTEERVKSAPATFLQRYFLDSVIFTG